MLVRLDHLKNMYKHRLLPVGILSVTELRLDFNFPEGSPEAKCECHFTDRPVANGAEFYRFRFAPENEYRVQVSEPPELSVWFDDLGLGHRWTFADLVEWVAPRDSGFSVVNRHMVGCVVPLVVGELDGGFATRRLPGLSTTAR